MKILENKKGQIGATITWFVAFLIIFFMLMLFMFFTSILAAGKVVPVFGSGRNDIKLESSSFDLKVSEDVRVLETILGSSVEYNRDLMSVKDLVSLWAVSDDTGRKQIEDAINSKANEVLLYLSEKDAACRKFRGTIVEQESNGDINEAIFIIPAGGKKVEVKLENVC